jgi:hypothetical protein
LREEGFAEAFLFFLNRPVVNATERAMLTGFPEDPVHGQVHKIDGVAWRYDGERASKAWFRVAERSKCWYCWATGPWYECHCEDAIAARAGKLAKPSFRTDAASGRLIVELPRHVRERHLAAGRMQMAPVKTEAINAPSVNASEAPSVNINVNVTVKDRRREAAREGMRKLRAERRGRSGQA